MKPANSIPVVLHVGVSILAAFVAVCVAPGFAAAQGEANPLVQRGKTLFNEQCVICHGAQGDGEGTFAFLMNPRPRNLRQGNFKLATTVNRIPSDEDLLRTLRRGMPGSAMPPWGHLPESDLRALVAYVRELHRLGVKEELDRLIAEGSLAPEEAEEELRRRTEPGEAIRVPPEPEFDNLRWFRGRQIYLEACASCHGKDGEPVAEAVKFDAEGYPVPPRSFVEGIFKGGSEGTQLYARILKGLKGTPMPAYEGNYSGDEMWDMIHYVQSLAKQGAQDRAQLGRGVIEAPSAPGALPSGPLDEAWDRALPLYVALTPLWWSEQRIEGVVVQALHNGEELALRFSWIDPTTDDRNVRTDEFRDAVAVQFSLTPDPPFYMGSPGAHGGVNMWMWKADREAGIESGHRDLAAAYPNHAADMYQDQSYSTPKDRIGAEWPLGSVVDHNPLFITAWAANNLVANPELSTPVECLTAQGPGTLSAKPAAFQTVQGQAEYKGGVWYVQMQRTMGLGDEHAHGHGDDERVFRIGDYIPVSFAIWDGSAGDRGGKKNISIWQRLLIK